MSKHFSRIMATGVAVSLASMLSLGGAAGLARSGAVTPTRVLTCNFKLTSKPSAYLLSCADANADWTGVTWSNWNASSATGHGTLQQNNCTPNCAAGQFLSYRASVTLSKVVATKKYGDLFSRATFHYRAGGKAKTEVFGLAD
jgi:hypothetical protein